MPVPPGVSYSSVEALVRLLQAVKFTSDGELWTTETERENNVHVLMDGGRTTAGTSWYGLIDISDTNGWPHDFAGPVHVSVIYLNLDKAAAARGTLAVGTITRIDGTNADVEFFSGISFTENDSSSINEAANIAPTQLKTNLAGNTLRDFKTSIKATNVTALNTGTTVQFGSAGPTFTPALGDIVVRLITTTAGNVNFIAGFAYHTHAA